MGGAEEGKWVDGPVVCGRRFAMDDDDDDDIVNDALWFQFPMAQRDPDLL
jgi:hypothetical protein